MKIVWQIRKSKNGFFGIIHRKRQAFKLQNATSLFATTLNFLKPALCRNVLHTFDKKKIICYPLRVIINYEG
jgi:hypothetical protein